MSGQKSQPQDSHFIRRTTIIGIILSLGGCFIAIGEWWFPRQPAQENAQLEKKVNPDAGRKLRDGLLPTSMRVKNIPPEQNQFFKDQQAAKDRGESKQFAAACIHDPPSFSGWTCTVWEVHVHESHIRALFDAPDRTVTGDCFMSTSVPFADFENLARGTGLVLLTANLKEIRPNGWLVLNECKFSIVTTK